MIGGSPAPQATRINSSRRRIAYPTAFTQYNITTLHIYSRGAGTTLGGVNTHRRGCEQSEFAAIRRRGHFIRVACGPGEPPTAI